jgi:hypothetical protein
MKAKASQERREACAQGIFARLPSVLFKMPLHGAPLSVNQISSWQSKFVVSVLRRVVCDVRPNPPLIAVVVGNETKTLFPLRHWRSWIFGVSFAAYFVSALSLYLFSSCGDLRRFAKTFGPVYK